MKLSSTLLSSCFLASAVSARNAYLYTFDDRLQHVPSQSTTLSPSTALSIIARRRNIPQNVYLSNVGDALLEQIDSYGGYQQPLFGEANKSAPRSRLFIRISGYSGEALNGAFSSLTISNVGNDFSTIPHLTPEEYCVLDNGNAFDYVLAMDGEIAKGYETVETVGTDVGARIFVKQMNGASPSTRSLNRADEGPQPSCRFVTDFILKEDAEPLGQLSKLLRTMSESDSDHPLEALPQVLDVLHQLAGSESVQSTLLLVPELGPDEKTSVVSGWLTRREEEPLDLATPDFTSISPPTILASNFTIPSNLPACFSSQSACENATNSCLGHGACVKSRGSCFKCACNSTVIRKNADGSTKSVQWAGAACQKKDISVPFILFASFGVIMTALVTGTIGMLYSMGGQELPSVIGAGVAGPRAK